MEEVNKTPVAPEVTQQPQVRLVDIQVTDDNVALNLMVSFLNLAQKRGSFNLDESSKIWECIQNFTKKANV